MRKNTLLVVSCIALLGASAYASKGGQAIRLPAKVDRNAIKAQQRVDRNIVRANKRVNRLALQNAEDGVRVEGLGRKAGDKGNSFRVVSKALEILARKQERKSGDKLDKAIENFNNLSFDKSKKEDVAAMNRAGIKIITP